MNNSDILYDNYGNITNLGDVVIDYNSKNLMESYTDNNNKYSFEYNYQGIRTKKKKIRIMKLIIILMIQESLVRM